MPAPQFHETVMGRCFYEVTMPALVDAIKGLAVNPQDKGSRNREHLHFESTNKIKRIIQIFSGLDRADMTLTELQIHVVISGKEASVRSESMACLNCDHKMQCVAGLNDQPVFWCPRCGTLKMPNGAETSQAQTNSEAMDNR